MLISLGRLVFNMPWSALPEHIDEPNEWNGKDDDDHWYTKWRKSIKGWFAFGPRCTEKWAKFREFPIMLFAVGSMNQWRFESNDNLWYSGSDNSIMLATKWTAFYLSRVQYGKQWHIALQWPLFLHGHFGEWQFYIGFKRDADRVYWLAFYIGKKWK